MGGIDLIMKRAILHLTRWRWDVVCYFDVDASHSNEILDILEDFGCSEDNLLDARRNLKNGRKNEGLTYSNLLDRRSIFVVGETSSQDEFYNTWHHELKHLTDHIIKSDRIDPFSEEAAYLVGDVAKAMYRILSDYVCECVS